ncbi:MAG: hypothetical protein COA78_25555 [Blastopirellula sp.]|nr:MAG: hypothetical protein COA78_25555 [Blastopirellula sp.]
MFIRIAVSLFACLMISHNAIGSEPLAGEWKLDAKSTLKEVEQYLQKKKFVAGQIKQILDYYKAQIIPNMTMEIKEDAFTFTKKKGAKPDTYKVLSVKREEGQAHYTLDGGPTTKFELHCKTEKKLLYINSKGFDDYIGLVWVRKEK